jgi:hypothetical protein
MDTRKAIASKNIQTLLELNQDSISNFARRSGMAPSTLTTFLKYPEDRNITLDHLLAISDISGIELWTLFVPNFPYRNTQGKRITNISADGYALLHIYESATDEQRKSLLDYASYQMRGSAAESKVRDVQSRYLTPTPINTPIRYKGCNEDHDK